MNMRQLRKQWAEELEAAQLKVTKAQDVVLDFQQRHNAGEPNIDYSAWNDAHDAVSVAMANLQWAENAERDHRYVRDVPAATRALIADNID